MTSIKPPDGYPAPDGRAVSLADEARRWGMNPATLRSRMARNDGPPAFRPGGNGGWTTYSNWFEHWLFLGGVVGGEPHAPKPKTEIEAV
jgi:hypothetical protein